MRPANALGLSRWHMAYDPEIRADVARLGKAIENLARAIQYRDDEFTVGNCLNEVRTYLSGLTAAQH
jgi:hypothetical protein